VEVDWLNIFLQVSALHNIKSFFDKKDCTVNPTNLRVDGKFREFTDWEQVQRNCAVTDEQLLQLKNAANDFKRDRNRAYKTTERNLNKRTEAPLNFAFKHDYDHESVAKCVHCHTWLFWPEKSQKEWCCGQGKVLDHMNPWTQPTDAYRQLCIGTSREATLFRRNCRKLNNENSFASWGIKWGMEHKEKYPSMVTISGLSYMRLLHGDAKGPLQSYIHDVDYQYESLQLPEIIRSM
jgi:hypothetical protein